jgi:hypothetical protein
VSGFPGLSQNSSGFATLLEMERSKRFPFCGKLDLGQNYPNPFRNNQATTIDYRAMDVDHASLVIYDPEGKNVLVVAQLPPGAGKISVQPGQLSPGIYTYALIVNGRMIDRRKMVITY